MPIPKIFLDLVKHPAPGLHFPPHEEANLPARLIPAPHAFGAPATKAELEKLDALIGDLPAVKEQFREFYGRWNGAGLCCMVQMGEQMPSLLLMPIADWDEATAELTTGDLAFIMEGTEEFLPPGRFIVIGGAESEATRLLLALDGKWEGKPLAGRICYASMDPVLAVGEPVADSLFDLLDQFARAPAAFLERIGASAVVESEGLAWGDVADSYVPDCGNAE